MVFSDRPPRARRIEGSSVVAARSSRPTGLTVQPPAGKRPRLPRLLPTQECGSAQRGAEEAACEGRIDWKEEPPGHGAGVGAQETVEVASALHTEWGEASVTASPTSASPAARRGLV